MEKTKYILISKSGDTKFFIQMPHVNRQIDQYMLRGKGVFYLISIYPLFTSVEEFFITEENGRKKIYRIDSKNF